MPNIYVCTDCKSATAKIAELEGEAAAYLQIGIGPNEGMVQLAKHIPKNYDKTWWKFEPLFTHPSADAKDAARYRWLRNKANYSYKSAPMVCIRPLDQQELIDGERLDKEIDAAMAAERK